MAGEGNSDSSSNASGCVSYQTLPNSSDMLSTSIHSHVYDTVAVEVIHDFQTIFKGLF